MPTVLNSLQIRNYSEQGVHWPNFAMSPQQARGYADKVIAFERDHPGRARQILRQKSHLVLTWVNEIIRNDNILDAVGSIIGPDIMVWSTSFFIKDGGDQKFVGWHQDAPYWGVEADDIVTAWVALTPSHSGNGCLRVVQGSHGKEVPSQKRPDKNNLLLQGQDIAAEVRGSDGTDIVLKAGEFSMHHQMIIHGSGPNTSNERRVGLAIRYLKPSARQTVEATDSATLVRGTDKYENFQHEPRPQADMHPDAVKYLDDLLAVRYGGRYRPDNAAAR